MTRAGYFAASIGFLSVVFAVAHLGVAIVDREPPGINTVIQSIPPIALLHPGGSLQVKLTIDYVRGDCSAVVNRNLVDANGINYQLPSFSRKPFNVGHQIFITATYLPEAMALGEAHYQVHAEYACNWIHRVFWPIKAEPWDIAFTVTEKEA
jgi:hypothetical protein